MNNIVLFIDSQAMGGIETHVLNLAKALSVRNMQVSVVFWKEYQCQPHPITELLAESKIDFSCAKGRIRTLLKLIPAGSVVHSHGYKANILNKALCLIGRWTAIPTHHNGDIGTGKLRWYTAIDEFSSSFFTPISVSQPIFQRLKNRGKMIPNFVEAISERSPVKGRQIAFVGRLSPEKNPEDFCLLAASLQDTLAERGETFHIYGDGPERAHLEQRFPLVKFHGQQDMNQHWQDVGLLCITSVYEGLPLVALEAMARGIPVCSYAVGELPCLIRHKRNGWLIRQNDINPMADAIHQWWRQDKTDIDIMSWEAIKTIRDKYSTDAVIPEIIKLYQSKTTVSLQQE